MRYWIYISQRRVRSDVKALRRKYVELRLGPLAAATYSAEGAGLNSEWYLSEY
jgi:hypothetical protein